MTVRLALLALILVVCGLAGPAIASADKVLILEPTVSGGTSSREAQAAESLGFQVEVVSPDQWSSKSASDFSAYRAIILGDPTCSSVNAGPVAAAEANTNVWAPQVNGNAIIIGTDPVYHAPGQPGAQQLIEIGIQYATAQAGKTGAYIDLSCYYHETGPNTPVPLLEGFSNGGFTVRGVGCYNEAHITAVDSILNGLTDDALSGWGCSVHEAFDSYPSDFVVLAMARNIGSTYTAPDGTVGTPYILARGAGTYYAGLSYVALGDSVSAGEGIGYGWNWSLIHNAWEGGDSSGTWDPTYETTNCHQTAQGFPHVAASLLNAGLQDFACTGSGSFNGVLGERVNRGLFGLLGNWTAPAQLGSSIGLPGTAPPNPEYDAAKPDLVSLTLGADDVHFADIVSGCYKGPCNTDPHSLDAPLAAEAGDLSLVLDEVHRRGVADGRNPLVVVGQYYDPFPAYDWSCADINAGYPVAWLSKEQMDFLVSGLARLNHNIAQVAAAKHALLLNTSALLKDHRFCSPDGPWVYGPSIKLKDFPFNAGSQAPFHPTPEGQQAIGQAMANLVADKLPVGTGTNVHLSLPHGQLQFSDVATAGEAAIIPADELPGSVPSSNTFSTAAAYDISSSADYSGDITVSLPAGSALDLYHYVGGAWQQVASTFDGSYVSGVVSSLSPFALGSPVSPVHADVAPAAGGQAPVAVKFDASSSSVEDGSGIASYEWDFGDQQTGSGPTPTHMYALSGTYTVTVTVTAVDGAVATTSTQVTVTNAPPQAVLAGPSAGETGQALSYNSSESSDPNGSVVGELWDFGDRSTPVSGTQVSHSYSAPGTYQMTLTVRDNEGAPNSVTLPVTITAPGGGVGPGGAGAATTETHGVLGSIAVKRPAIGIASKLTRDRRGHLLVTARCLPGAGPCRGTVTLQTRSHGKRRTIGKASYALSSGNTAKIAVAIVKKFATTARTAAITVNLVATVIGGDSVAVSCHLAAASGKHKSHHG